MGELKRVTKKEYLEIKKKIFPNDEAKIKDTEDIKYAYQKTFYTMRVQYKHYHSEIEYFVPYAEWDDEYKIRLGIG